MQELGGFVVLGQQVGAPEQQVRDVSTEGVEEVFALLQQAISERFIFEFE